MKIYITYNLNELIKAIHSHPTWRSKERSGLLKVSKHQGHRVAYDIFFPSQSNSSALTTMTKDINDELAPYLAAKNDMQSYSNYSIWLHSHHGMNCFWSGTDVSTRKSFRHWDCDEYVSIVTGHKSGSNNCDGVYYHATLDVFKPIDLEYDVPVILGVPGVSTTKIENTKEFLDFQANKELIHQKYSIPLEELDKCFDGQEEILYYSEPAEYNLDIELKIQELKDKEVKPKFAPYHGGPGLPTYAHQTPFNGFDNSDYGFDKLFGGNGKKKNPKANNKSKVIEHRGSNYYTKLGNCKPKLSPTGEIILGDRDGTYVTALGHELPLSRYEWWEEQQILLEEEMEAERWL